jgi:hypothetical protein
VNDYDKLLEYLDSIKEKSEETGIKLKKEKQLEVAKANKESVASEIDKLLEVSQITDIFETPQSLQSVRGFDITRFENMMRSKLIEEHKKMQSYERPYISVTELFNCMRSNYYTRVKYQVDVKDLFKFAYLKIIQEVGNTIHELVQSIYDFSETEKTIISEKYKVKGRMDAAKENFLYEIKTMDEAKFTGKYNLDHYHQGNIYSFILNNEYNYNIDTIIILYFFRDNLKRRPAVFEINVDPKQAEFYVSKANILLSYIQRKEVPDVIGSTEEQCKYCLYKKFCEKDESKSLKPYMKKEEVQIIKEKPKTVFLM